MCISLGLRRANRLPGGFLLAVVAILVRVQVERKGGILVVAFFKFFFTLNISPGLRGRHPLADESLLTVAAILVRIQAERESCCCCCCCFLTLTDPLRIQPWSQDRRNQTKSNRESEMSMESRQKRTDKK